MVSLKIFTKIVKFIDLIGYVENFMASYDLYKRFISQIILNFPQYILQFLSMTFITFIRYMSMSLIKICCYTLLSFLNKITFSNWFMINTKLVDFCMLCSIQQHKSILLEC